MSGSVRSGTVAWEIYLVDHWERDAYLRVGGVDLYFQFSPEAGPTLEQALTFIRSEQRRDART